MSSLKCPTPSVNRRSFLQVSLALGGGLILSSYAQASESSETMQTKTVPNKTPPPKPEPTQDPEFFLRISPENRVELVINRIEFGQGIATAFALLVAEELDVPVTSIDTRLGSNHPAYVDPVARAHLTGGSSSIKNSYLQYRRLGATVREMLRQAAAQHWKTDIKNISTEAGHLVFGQERKSYGALASAAAELPVPQEVPLKSAKKFKLIGQSTRRLDAQEITTGRKTFGLDFRPPGTPLLVALLVQNPSFAGGRVTAAETVRASQSKGVKAVFKVSLGPRHEGVAIVAESFWAAKKARDLLNVTFEDVPENADLSTGKLRTTMRSMAENPEALALNWQNGGSREALAAAKERIVIEYEFPYLAHAAMEPLNCTVELTDTRCNVWTGTQSPGGDARAVAALTGLPPEAITVQVLPAGGSFGRRATPSSDVVSHAVRVAKEWKKYGGSGALKLIWTREDDMMSGHYRPMHLHRAELGFGPKGELLAWDHVIVGQSIAAGTPFAGALTKNGADRLSTEGLLENTYGLPLRLRVSHPKLPVPVLWWRSVGHSHTAYVTETLIDEVARRSRQDPVAFRRKRFRSDPNRFERHRKALDLAVAKSGYGKRTLGAGRAWGVAVHGSFDSVVAYVVEVSLEKGLPVVHRVTAGVHCNTVINPLTAQAQIEGAMIYGATGLIPRSEITLAGGKPEQSQFTDFQVPRISDFPARVDVHFVPSDAPPTGLGEPGLPPYLPAVANAMAKLTGSLISKLPLSATS